MKQTTIMISTFLISDLFVSLSFIMVTIEKISL